MNSRLVIATRESRLALWQAEHVRSALQRLYPALQVEIPVYGAIDSLNVAPTDDPTVSRVTLVISGSDAAIGQLNTQLAKLVDVVHALDHTGDAHYETEIALIKLACALDERTQILQIAEHFGAKVVDYGPDSLMLRVYGASDKLEASIGILRGYTIVELVRSEIGRAHV